MFPAFGVGAKIPHVPDNHQFFHLNFEAQPHCRGIDGLLDAYRNAKRKVIPIANDRTVYLSVVNTVAKMAENEGKHGLHYFVLLIFISNSSIDNSKKLFNAITNVTKAPISIIFLGRQVAELNEFYSITSNRKNTSLCSGGIAMNSDFVEFIDLNSVMIQEATLRQNAKRIAERALRNVPWHLIAYMHKNNIAAKPPIQINRSSVFHSSHLIPNQPSQYVERLHWDRNEQNFIGFITPTASRKHVKSVERNANEEKFRKKTMFHSQSVMSRGDRDEELNSSTAHQLTPKYHSQRHPTRVLRRQLAIS
ncbi:unnamed protein product [Litomosoides sigmodontis]|uniref:Copine C-terminal domain-containing protein n=1 Tax=Litomosoides sigmodontis TaxID=42156 RepID=A0A3P6TMZ9_LITSI|nr:unnamed protein product [Litomosoides sigmodontis]